MRNSLGRAVSSLVWLSVSMAQCTRHAHVPRPPARLPTSRGRQRACPPRRVAGPACPDRVRLILASAHLDAAPAQHAPIAFVLSTRCRSREKVITACSVAAAARSLMPISTQCRLVVPWSHLQCYRSCSPSRGAGAFGSLACRVRSRSCRAGPTGACSRRRSRRARSGRFYALLSAIMASQSTLRRG